jgi:hypothetical protein
MRIFKRMKNADNLKTIRKLSFFILISWKHLSVPIIQILRFHFLFSSSEEILNQSKVLLRVDYQNFQW